MGEAINKHAQERKLTLFLCTNAGSCQVRHRSKRVCLCVCVCGLRGPCSVAGLSHRWQGIQKQFSTTALA